ncbi:hypothetical protein Tcan_13813 [Toxocara canis]|uniref:VWFA domain-containing protein n=1 Tax=Toxocara canis TaxID=6265 RepID=A0A0B2VQT3_TOXCA|nr:hypothetical protein Tcan_13813 [Toxocara canis]
MILVVQSTFDVSKKDFEDVKEFLKQYVGDLDVGFNEKQTRVGVVLFDRVHEPRYRIKLDQVEEAAHLQKAIASLHRLPCSYWWCRANLIHTPFEAAQFALYILNENALRGRMKKLLIILHGKESFEAAKQIASLTSADFSLRIAQVLVVPGRP